MITGSSPPRLYDALGVPRKAPISAKAIDSVVELAKPRTRDNIKQAQVIAMLKRPEGVTIAQICEATGWQQHTRHFCRRIQEETGACHHLRKTRGAERIYRIV